LERFSHGFRVNGAILLLAVNADWGSSDMEAVGKTTQRSALATLRCEGLANRYCLGDMVGIRGLLVKPSIANAERCLSAMSFPKINHRTVLSNKSRIFSRFYQKRGNKFVCLNENDYFCTSLTAKTSMYIEQSIDALLFEWKNSKSLKPLLLRGAHQVGK